jgi:hypothetical protein
MNTKTEFILKFDSRYKIVCVLKKLIISDFAETNVVVPFPLLLKIVSEFQSILGFFVTIIYLF